jgi:RhoGEF domain
VSETARVHHAGAQGRPPGASGGLERRRRRRRGRRSARRAFLSLFSPRLPFVALFFATIDLRSLPPSPVASFQQLDLNWFFGKIGRQESEDILHECAEDALMIRVSTMMGYFALSKVEAKTKKFTHVLIAPCAAGYKLENSTDKGTYTSVPHIIRESPIASGCKPAGMLTSRRPRDPDAMNVPTASMPKASTGRNAVASKRNMKRAMTQAANISKAKAAAAAKAKVKAAEPAPAPKPAPAPVPKIAAPKGPTGPKPVFPTAPVVAQPKASDGVPEENTYGKAPAPPAIDAATGQEENTYGKAPAPPAASAGPTIDAATGQEENTYGKAPAPPAASAVPVVNTPAAPAIDAATGQEENTYGKAPAPPTPGAPSLGLPPSFGGPPAIDAATGQEENTYGKAPAPPAAQPTIDTSTGQEENTYGKAPAPPGPADAGLTYGKSPAPAASGPAAPIGTREHVVDEIMNTERDYSNSLGLLMKHYVAPLQQELRDEQMGGGKPTLSQQDLDSLFSNLSALLDTSYNLLNTLEARKRETGGKYLVGDVFKQLADDFKIYTTYCCNHPAALLTYQRLVSSSSSFAEMEKRITATPDMQNIDLCGYLIKPVQRIMKYPLLLSELVKHTEEGNYMSLSLGELC